MTIGYIGSFHRIHDEEGIACSLEKLNINVVRFQIDDFYLNYEDNINKIFSSNLDFLMSPTWEIPNSQYIIEKCKKHNIKTITWHPDGYYNYTISHEQYMVMGNPNWIGTRHDSVIAPKESRNLAYCTDYVCTPEGYANEIYRELGINHFVLRQGIYNECCYKGIPNYQPYDILFVGSTSNAYHTYRKSLINYLKNTYEDRFLHIGENENDVRGDELNNLIASCKVIIGESIFHPQYWSNRIYETIGRGGFCLHAYHEGIENEYKIKEHFDVFYRDESFEVIKEKIDYWINNNEEREKIAINGMIHTQKYHTLANRANQLIDILTNN
jgi:hypothetical protein